MKMRSPEPDFTIDKSGERIDLGLPWLAVMLAVGILIAMGVNEWARPEPSEPVVTRGPVLIPHPPDERAGGPELGCACLDGHHYTRKEAEHLGFLCRLAGSPARPWPIVCDDDPVAGVGDSI